VVKVVFVDDGDDWHGIYVDGKLISEGHEIGWVGGFVRTVLPHVSGKEWVFQYRSWIPDEDTDGLPENLADVPEEEWERDYN
jgi:hypothetical protein